jgi:hypothetical protein
MQFGSPSEEYGDSAFSSHTFDVKVEIFVLTKGSHVKMMFFRDNWQTNLQKRDNWMAI